ncbi:hypothetical protein MASR2M78_15150 [Treponema sp.]
MFTHQGLSGPGILDLSRAMRSGDELRIPLANNLNKDAEGLRGTELESYFMGESAENGKRSLFNI